MPAAHAASPPPRICAIREGLYERCAAGDGGEHQELRRECDGEQRRQPVQIDGDDALTLPVSIALAAGAVRLLRPA